MNTDSIGNASQRPTKNSLTTSQLAFPNMGLSGFGMGVTVETSEGPQPVEWLRPGDLLKTKDHGFQPLIWAGRSGTQSMKCASPVRISAQSLGHDSPKNDLILSGDHHLLLQSPHLELYFGEHEALARACEISPQDEEDYAPLNENYGFCHLLLKNHEVILAEDIWVESLWADPRIVSQLDEVAQQQIKKSLGVRFGEILTARRVLNATELRLVRPRETIATLRLAA